MAVEAGKEFNPETARDLRPRKFEFVVYGETFRYELMIPEYILHRLDSAVMDRLYSYMHEYASRLVLDAIRSGTLYNEFNRAGIVGDVGWHLKNYIWERFSIAQEKAGNDCWEVAPTLQKVMS